MKLAIDKQPDQPQSTRIIFLLDRSSSMERMKEEAVSGYNQYLSKQQAVEGEASISLIFFDSTYSPVYENKNIKQAQAIKLGSRYNSTYTHLDPIPGYPRTRGFSVQDTYDVLEYHPQGMTSLFDFIHGTIMRYKDTAKPGEKTIFAILTDGEDTSSRQHNYQTVQAAIKEVQDGLGWEVLFLGANMNARAFAQTVGIKASNVAQFDYTKKGIGDAINTMSFASSYTRGDSRTLKSAAACGATLSTGEIDVAAAYAAVASGKLDEEEKKDDQS